MLTQRTKYALRAMLLLAAQPKGGLMLVGDIADTRKIPRKFLEQILLELKSHGLLTSVRGKHGGYKLGRPAEKITYGEIIRITDGALAPIACASLAFYRKCDDCEDEKVCAIRKTMRAVRDSMAEILDTVTLADGAAREKKGGARVR